MIKNFVSILIAYLHLNRRWILPLFAFPLLWRLISLTSNLDRDLSINFLVSKTLVITFLLPLLISDLLFSLGLGLSFKRKGNESWLSRLPINNFTLITIPLFLLIAFGFLIYCLFPKAWEYTVELTGFPIVFMLGVVPISTYYSVRSTKNSPTGIFCGAFIGFLVLGLGEFLIQLVSGNFGSIGNYSLLFNLSFLRLAIELLCTVSILFVIIKAESLPRNVNRLMLIGSSCIGLICITLFLQFQKKQQSYSSLLEPLERAVFESERNKSRCDQFRSFVARAIDGHPAESPLRDRNEVLRAISELKEYPPSTVSKVIQNTYDQNIPRGLAEGLILQKTFGIYDCQIVSKFDLQRGLINTLSKKPSYLTDKDLVAIRQAVWSSLAITDASSGTFIEGIIIARLLEILSQRGFIDHQFKLEILEINRDFEEERKKLQNTNALFAFKMPSEERIHLIFEAMKKEIQFADSMKTRLKHVITKSEQSQK